MTADGKQEPPDKYLSGGSLCGMPNYLEEDIDMLCIICYYENSNQESKEDIL